MRAVQVAPVPAATVVRPWNRREPTEAEAERLLRWRSNEEEKSEKRYPHGAKSEKRFHFHHKDARHDFADLSTHTPRATFAPRPQSVADGRQRARFLAELKFFDPHRSRTGREIERRAQQERHLYELAHHRYYSLFNNDKPQPINLNGCSARWLVTIERQGPTDLHNFF